MKKKLLLALLAVVMCLLLIGCGREEASTTEEPKPAGTVWNTSSPDGTLKAELLLDVFGTLRYKVTKNNVTVVDDSALGFVLEEEDLTQMLSFVSVSRETVACEYENISGKHKTVKSECNQTTVTLSGSEYYLDVTMRAYNDGYAFRYGIRARDGSEGVITVEEEKSEFALPAGSVTWGQIYKTNMTDKNCFSYEEKYARRKSDSLDGKQISMPMLYRAGTSEVYSLITESGLIGSGYYGSFLAEQAENAGTGVLQTIQSPAGVQADGNVICYPFVSPWRVAATGTLAEVVESEIVEKVYDDASYWKPDDYDSLSAAEKATYEYDWVEPGIVAWNWIKYPSDQTDYSKHREYVDLAAQMGWKYVILDGGWDAGLNVASFKEFMQYAHSKDVKVIVWCNALTSFGNCSADVLRNLLETWKSYGIDGIKIDFFDGQNATNPTHQGEDIDTIKWYETIYRETARLEMVVNCHGANKPTGERRVYPHVITREGIRGNEFKNIDSTITVNSMFTRAIVGPSDFTPVVKPLSKGLTMGHQMALAILYESGAVSMADLPSEYTNDTVKDFYMAVPSARDDTKFLCGSPDEYYCAAAKAGEEWFVGGINSVTERTVTLDLSFLGEGEYIVTIWNDVAGDYQSVEKIVQSVNSSSVLTLQLVANGGFALHIVRK